MPFYEYECASCKFYTEVMQKISDAPMTKCPSCGKKAMKKLVSAPNFRLKGGGWYETDFKGDKENKRNLAGADKDEPAAKSDTVTPAVPAESAKTDPTKATTAHGDTPKDQRKHEPKPDPKAAKESKSSAESDSRGRGKSTGKSAKRAAPPGKSRPVPARAKAKSRPVKKKARR